MSMKHFLLHGRHIPYLIAIEIAMVTLNSGLNISIVKLTFLLSNLLC